MNFDFDFFFKKIFRLTLIEFSLFLRSVITIRITSTPSSLSAVRLVCVGMAKKKRKKLHGQESRLIVSKAYGSM